jgi:Lrp/AsnC family leucine-responsive transcriptional regulator
LEAVRALALGHRQSRADEDRVMANALFQRGFDQLDLAILRELQCNSRISVADLARQIHLSPPAVHQRIKRLERAGVIRQYAALLDTESVGLELLAFILLGVENHTHAQFEAINASVAALPAVLECYRVTGGHDLLLKVVVASHKELDHFISQHLMTIPGVGRIETSTVLQALKSTTALPLK